MHNILVHVHSCVYMQMCIYACVCMCAYISVYACICVCVYTCIHTHECLCVYAYVCMFSMWNSDKILGMLSLGLEYREYNKNISDSFLLRSYYKVTDHVLFRKNKMENAYYGDWKRQTIKKQSIGKTLACLYQTERGILPHST